MGNKNIINPFINKGRIITGNEFIGRLSGLKNIQKNVTNLSIPINLAIIGYPRVGKSSLAKQSLFFLDHEQNHKIFIWIDFSSFSNRDTFFKGLVRYSYRELGKKNLNTAAINIIADEILKSNKDWDDLKFDVENYFEEVRYQSIYTVFILDEFDEARKKFENNTEAFRELRHLAYDASKFGIALVTTSRRSIREIEIQSKVSSTLDGLFSAKEYLGMYDPEEIQEYYNLLTGLDINLDNRQKEDLIFYCGNHPYLLALFGFEIVELFKENSLIDIHSIYKRIQLQVFNYYEQLIDLLKEDKTYSKLIQILFGPKINVRLSDIDELLIYGIITKGIEEYIAFSKHFQGYLNVIHREEKIDIETWQLLSRAEKGLRQFALKIFINKFGENWIIDYPNYYSSIPQKKELLTKKISELIKSQERDSLQYGTLALNLSILDQTYIHQLFDYFILFSWDDIFSKSLPKDKKYWKEAKDLLEKIRNPFAHHKVELLQDWEIVKAETLCKEIINIVEHN